MELQLTVHGVDFTVTGTRLAACKGAWEGGLQLEPDEPTSFEISAIKIGTVEVTDVLSEGTAEAIQEAADAQVRS